MHKKNCKKCNGAMLEGCPEYSGDAREDEPAIMLAPHCTDQISNKMSADNQKKVPNSRLGITRGLEALILYVEIWK